MPDRGGVGHGLSGGVSMIRRQGIDRQTALASEAYKLRKAGHAIEVVREKLRALNIAECSPPLPAKEVQRLADGKGPVTTPAQINRRNQEFRRAVEELRKVRSSASEQELERSAQDYVYLKSLNENIPKQQGTATSVERRASQNIERDRRIHDARTVALAKGKKPSPKLIGSDKEIVGPDPEAILSASQVRRIWAKPRP